MYVTPLPPLDGFLAFCNRACVDAWADDDPDEDLVGRAVRNDDGPPWCVHCHQCGARAWRGTDCPLCPDCANGRWDLTAQAERFAIELGRHDLTVLPEHAWARGEQLCALGLGPRSAAHLLMRRYQR